MANVEDNRALKMARSAFSKHGIDMGRAELRVTRGVLHVAGVIQISGRKDREMLKKEVETVVRGLRLQKEFTEVVVAATYTT
ncbi:hypothetical protein EON81_10120 [bacterium]|nr:MAG: hypothetical protein EON81_10120 [bacterium]